MPVRLEFAVCDVDMALLDLKLALDQALRAGGPQGRADHADLLDLLTKHLQEDLSSRSETALASYAASSQIWRREGEVDIIKTPNEPCVAYTLLQRDGDVVILILGFVYRYPTTEDAWWTGVLLPRLRHYQ